MKPSFFLWAKTVSFGLLAAAGLLFVTSGCEGGLYTTGTVGYDYDYYPDADVYYYPHDQIYFWHDGDYWRHGRHVPDIYRLPERPHEHLYLHSREPWTEHRPERHEFEGHYRFEGHENREHREDDERR